jgi:metal-responsive CopG/Arc/MetJ family transcriptional regulator
MATKAPQKAESTHDHKTTRASVSFPNDLYETLERIAKEKKVSVAWIVRDAAEKYVNEQWPLLGGREWK